jgi:hypothetical protein
MGDCKKSKGDYFKRAGVNLRLRREATLTSKVEELTFLRSLMPVNLTTNNRKECNIWKKYKKGENDVTCFDFSKLFIRI